MKLSNNYGGDVFFTNIDTASDYHSIYLDELNNYELDSNGDAYFKILGCERLDVPGCSDFKVVSADDRTFTIQFEYNGKTYRFTPSDTYVGVS